MTDEELKKGLKNTLIVLIVLIIIIIGLGIYVFANRNNQSSVFTSAEVREEYEKRISTTENYVEEITDQNKIDQILNTSLDTAE